MSELGGGGGASVRLAQVEAIQKLFANRTHNLTLDRWDDFNRADGQLSTSNGGMTPSGHTWNFGYAAPATAPALVITGGQLYLIGAGASYMWTVGARHVEGHSVEFAFQPGSTINASVGLICSKLTGPNPVGASGVATNAVHAGVGPHTWSIGIFNGVSLSLIANGTFATDLTADGSTRYRFSVRRIGPDRVLLELPAPDAATGKTEILVRDRRIPQWWGATSLIEHFQPAGTLGTDKLPIITGYGVDGAEPRQMPMDPPAGLGGIPGATPTATAGSVALITAFSRYTPIEVNDPISVTNAIAEVTVAATAGAKISAAIFEADENWQPTRLLADLGEQPIDAVAVLKWTLGTPLTLSRGRYMIGWRVSASATFRYVAYATPGAPGLKVNFGGVASFGATPFVEFLQAAEAYAAAWTDPPTAWTSATTSAIFGWLAPVQLVWTGI